MDTFHIKNEQNCFYVSEPISIRSRSTDEKEKIVTHLLSPFRIYKERSKYLKKINSITNDFFNVLIPERNASFKI